MYNILQPFSLRRPQLFRPLVPIGLMAPAMAMDVGLITKVTAWAGRRIGSAAESIMDMVVPIPDDGPDRVHFGGLPGP